MSSRLRRTVSIITVVKNDRSGLERTLRSMEFLGSFAADVQHIIVDGGSTDGTAELAKSAGAAVISEPDEGIADAFNKGVGLATGRWLHFLNAGDVMTDEFAGVVDWLGTTADPRALIVAGVRWPRSLTPLGLDPAHNKRLWLRMTVPHQGLFAPWEAFAKIGGFAPEWRVAMDYDWLLRAKQSGFHLQTLSTVTVVEMDDGGVSQTRKIAGALEQYRIQKGHRVGVIGLREVALFYYVAKSIAERAKARLVSMTHPRSYR